jgi:hypothetical protein
MERDEHRDSHEGGVGVLTVEGLTEELQEAQNELQAARNEAQHWKARGSRKGKGREEGEAARETRVE